MGYYDAKTVLRGSRVPQYDLNGVGRSIENIQSNLTGMLDRDDKLKAVALAEQRRREDIARAANIRKEDVKFRTNQALESKRRYDDQVLTSKIAVARDKEREAQTAEAIGMGKDKYANMAAKQLVMDRLSDDESTGVTLLDKDGKPTEEKYTNWDRALLSQKDTRANPMNYNALEVAKFFGDRGAKAQQIKLNRMK